MDSKKKKKKNGFEYELAGIRVSRVRFHELIVNDSNGVKSRETWTVFEIARSSSSPSTS